MREADKSEGAVEKPKSLRCPVVPGRLGEKTLRTMLRSIALALKDPQLSHRTRLAYLRHQSRLDADLKHVALARLKRQAGEEPTRAETIKQLSDDLGLPVETEQSSSGHSGWAI